MTKGLVLYTDNRLDPTIAQACRDRLVSASNGVKRMLVSLDWIDDPFWPDFTVVFAERGYLAMFRQILAGLEALGTDIAFLCEHDVIYHYSHFQFTPPRDDCYFYNVHTFKVDSVTGRAVTYLTKQTSGLCANRELLIAHYRERIRRVEAEGFSRRMGFEPGSHGRPERIDDVPSESWRSVVPNVDIRHGSNLTASRWSPDEFRTKPTEWQEVDAVPGWGVTRNRFKDFLQDVVAGEVTHVPA